MMSFEEFLNLMNAGNFREIAVSIIMRGGKEDLINTIGIFLANWDQIIKDYNLSDFVDVEALKEATVGEYYALQALNY